MKLPSVALHPIDESLLPEDISKLPRAPRRIMEILKKGSSVSLSSAEKSWSLDFCLSPREFNSALDNPLSHRLDSLTLEKTSLKPDAFDPGAKSICTGQRVNVPASLAFRSIGYKSEGLPGFDELGVPFNNRLGIIPNDQFGRVIDDNEGWSDSGTAPHIPGMYCAGWVKRGPTGVIASTMQDAFSTADAISEDWYSRDIPFLNEEGHGTGLGWDGVKEEAEKRGCRRVSWKDWQRIDAAEKRRGEARGKPREKFTHIQSMLAVID